MENDRVTRNIKNVLWRCNSNVTHASSLIGWADIRTKSKHYVYHEANNYLDKKQ